jgi:hypothetical protein
MDSESGPDARAARAKLRQLRRTLEDSRLSIQLRAEAAVEIARLTGRLGEYDQAFAYATYAGTAFERLGTPAAMNQAADAYRLGATLAQHTRNQVVERDLLRRAQTAFSAAGNPAAAQEVNSRIEGLPRPEVPIGSTVVVAATPQSPPHAPAPPPPAVIGAAGRPAKAPAAGETAPLAPRAPASSPPPSSVAELRVPASRPPPRPPASVVLEPFLKLAPDEPQFWEDLNQNLNVDELEEAAIHAPAVDLARTIAKIDQVATLWDRSLRRPESNRALLRRLTQNWFARRSNPGQQAVPKALAHGSRPRRGPVAHLLVADTNDPTQSSLVERLGKLQSACVKAGLRILSRTLILFFAALLACEIVLILLVAYSSGGSVIQTIPYIAVWPATILLVGFIGGERIYSGYYTAHHHATAARLWDQPPVRLAAYLVVMMIVQLAWFSSDTLFSLAFKIPGFVIHSGGGVNVAGVLAFATVVSALAVILMVMTYRQKAQSTHWTTIAGTIAYFGLTATVTLLTVAGGTQSALGFSSSGGTIAAVSQLAGGIPAWALFGVASILVGLLLIPFAATRLHRGPFEDRLAVGQAYLDDLDSLSAEPGVHRMPRLHETTSGRSHRNIRRALDSCFQPTKTAGRWLIGSLRNPIGVATSHAELEWSRGSEASEFLLHLSTLSPPTPTPAASAPPERTRVEPSRAPACAKCGDAIEEDSLFCSTCGTLAPAPE